MPTMLHVPISELEPRCMGRQTVSTYTDNLTLNMRMYCSTCTVADVKWTQLGTGAFNNRPRCSDIRRY